MKKLYIDYPDTKLWNALSWMYAFLTYLSIICVVVGSYFKTTHPYFQYVVLSEFIFSFLFFLDYITRWAYSKFSRRFVVNIFSIADLLSFFPFFIGIATWHIRNVESFNIFRVARVLRLFRIWKYLQFLQELWTAVKKNLYKYKIAFTLFMIVRLIWSFLVYSIETAKNPMFTTIPDAMRWALVTMATLWYWDKYPITMIGKVAASAIIIFWPIFLSIITSITIITFLDVVRYITKWSSQNYICNICLTPWNAVSDKYCPSCGNLLDK
jgi:voltage-gated potassium channel